MKRIALVLLLAAVPAVLHAQQPAPTPAPGRYIGVASCANAGCHGSTQALNTTHVLQNEYFTWLNSDRHAGAYNILFNDRSARIAKNMRLRKRAYESDVCLDCHTTNVPASKVEGIIDPEDGIQCETCHGPASGWRNEHTEEGWTHQQSVARGMIDLARIGTRAPLCTGCHLGDATRQVDHELIASGHPVLTFELDNYTETMPAHWTPGKDTHGVPAWALGQVINFRESLENLSRHARGQNWPEFSDLTCQTCHHALAGSQWRQDRGWPERAGLPAWSPQHWTILRLLIARVSPTSASSLTPLVTDLSRATARMNAPAAVANLADRTRRALDDVLPKIATHPWSEADVRAMMLTITDDRSFLVDADVQSAQQAALALQSLASVLTRRNPRLLRGKMMQSIDALFNEVQDRDHYDPRRFVEKLQGVRGAV
jgi:hypothetical protein